MLKWIAAQLTFFQFWTPDLLRTWGVGTPNGSLWTIPVEIQFYAFLPFMILFLKKVPILFKIVSISIISIVFNFYLSAYRSSSDNISDSAKLIMCSALPYLYVFLIGSGLYYYWDKVKFMLEGKGLYWFILFNILVLVAGITPAYLAVGVQLVSNIVLAILTISMAFTIPSLGKMLHGNDISYGIYIYHMLVINSFVELKLVGKLSFLFFAILLTIVVAMLSWTFVEKKALRLKH
jgi:peptidoglycan/LPS O-acetylase OafA/YrhL